MKTNPTIEEIDNLIKEQFKKLEDSSDKRLEQCLANIDEITGCNTKGS